MILVIINGKKQKLKETTGPQVSDRWNLAQKSLQSTDSRFRALITQEKQVWKWRK
jgi:hypothetical protein